MARSRTRKMKQAQSETRQGRMSTFGGPEDMGVASNEGLALVGQTNLKDFSELFLDAQPPGTTGLARRLNPDTFYIACRWNYSQTPARHLRKVVVEVTNPRNGMTATARPMDWGPAMWTERVADISPGLAANLGLETDDECVVRIPLPESVPVGVGAAIRDGERVFDAQPDSIDFRDRMYEPTLTEVPVERSLETFLREANPMILDQGAEGACVGFAVAAVANYLLRTRAVFPDTNPCSPRMLYEMARRYDEWPGEDYSGSSARGGMKGWHKHGVCSEDAWPYAFGNPDGSLSRKRIEDSIERPLGAYFRVNHKDIVAMHSAISEVGILNATALVHEGWRNVGSDGVIDPSEVVIGGHAFAIVGYDRRGFWIQNSWGEDWGSQGFCYITYDDWLANGKDVWVARLGAPVQLERTGSARPRGLSSGEMSEAIIQSELRPHIIQVGNDGVPKEHGQFGNSVEIIESILRSDFPRITESWSKKRILLCAHGGLVGEEGAIQRVADYRRILLENEIYPLSFIWNSDYWTILKNILKDAFSRRKSEGFLDWTKDFMLDRVDDTLEPLTRHLSGKAAWAEMKENALLATEGGAGAARIVVKEIGKLLKNESNLEIHVAAHSAGAVFMAPVIKAITGSGQVSFGGGRKISGLSSSVKTCTLWAAACTIELFKKYYMEALSGGNGRRLRELAFYTLTDQAERDDDCVKIYNKSLLYLVSNACEERFRIPLIRDGEPMLGMQKFIKDDAEITSLIKRNYVDWVLSPNESESDVRSYSTSGSHGGFDDDEPTVNGLLARILDGGSDTSTRFSFRPSAAAMKDVRLSLD